MRKHLTLLVLAVLLSPMAAIAQASVKPNILYIITDDQRYDSIQAFNRILHGRDHSALGYVESPNVDRLAAMGTTFINAYSHAQGCAPSRASIHYGRYPHRSGLYEFEYHNNTLPHWRRSMPEVMADLGYQTFHVGKLGVRIRTLNAQGKVRPFALYQNSISFKKMWNEGLSDWTKGTVKEINGVTLPRPVENVVTLWTPDGPVYTGSGLNNIPGFEDMSRRVDEKYDLIRPYPPGTHPPPGHRPTIYGGVSPQPAHLTRDARYTTELTRFLENPGEKLTIGSQTYTGVDTSRPLFAHLGFDFPHTPVLPPQSYRERFQKITYKIPVKDPDSIAKLPSQLKNFVEKRNPTDHFTDAEKQQMVQDYFAFCAFGDELVGQAADDFIAFSESRGEPWMIVYVCGDHGWKLNEHGSSSKFTPWKWDALNPIIVVSSDKQKFPAGKVVTDFAEFVDIMPTVIAAGGADLSTSEFDFLDGYDLAKVTSGELPPRPYIIGESHAVTGPRATLRTKDFMFSIKSRPNKKRGENFAWALNASYAELEPVLYDIRTDPDELNNLAHDPRYEEVASILKTKLIDIVLGDGRVEVNWEKWGTGTEFFISNFAEGSDDKTLDIPAEVMP
ncbi:MAG: sulfatase-like hydrolase/transferase [Planctomycetota bacterium]